MYLLINFEIIFKKKEYMYYSAVPKYVHLYYKIVFTIENSYKKLYKKLKRWNSKTNDFQLANVAWQDHSEK